MKYTIKEKVGLCVFASVIMPAFVTFAMSTKAERIVLDENRAGLHEIGECLTYALDAYMALKEKGIESHVIEFGWSDGKHGGNHAYIAFPIKGKWYGMDNLMQRPKELHGKNWEERTKNLFKGKRVVILTIDGRRPF